ncbi:YceI family protein [Sphingomonas arantia]|uniref:YceI family protein n=1 Tax=Sphingomonas arantia TaxID=1460676 RepID=A0ABW4TX16_9SPHN
MRTFIAPLALALAAATPALAQVPGQPNAAAVQAGSYATDPNHSQVAFAINHFGFNVYNGLFGNITGTLTLDPKAPKAAKVVIDVPVAEVVTTSAKLNEHLKTADFFDTAKFPTAHFESTSVVPQGTRAKITGNLTLHGVTRPVTLDARFVGTGANPMSKAQTVGFEATTQIQRSQFGIVKYVPGVADTVDLRITVAFEKK